MADNRLVITVAPQKDVRPHGNTYPGNAVGIDINIIITPTIHTQNSSETKPQDVLRGSPPLGLKLKRKFQIFFGEVIR